MRPTLSQTTEDYSFWKNLFLLLIFFTITPVTIATSLFSLLSLHQNQKPTHSQETLSAVFRPQSGVKVYASLPSTLPAISGEATSKDAREEIIRNYLSLYNSPLESRASLIVQTADKYSLDYRLITAVAQKESNLCKIIPTGTYNCWGWGIHSKGTLGFSSFDEGIEEVSKGLREDYLDKGYQTVEDIMAKYTPLSNGSWARGVNQFMTEME